MIIQIQMVLFSTTYFVSDILSFYVHSHEYLNISWNIFLYLCICNFLHLHYISIFFFSCKSWEHRCVMQFYRICCNLQFHDQWASAAEEHSMIKSPSIVDKWALWWEHFVKCCFQVQKENLNLSSLQQMRRKTSVYGQFSCCCSLVFDQNTRFSWSD